ncbi:MAG: Fur family transcriptional regulator [Gammaproteobacteria bacterium]
MKKTVTPARPEPRGLRVNDRRVLGVLEAADAPLRAYELLDLLRRQGINGPPTVYRALERLTRRGLVHRIESMNAYIACRTPCHGNPPILMICDRCGSTEELHEDMIVARLRRRARALGLELDTIYLELRGRCARCGTAST